VDLAEIPNEFRGRRFPPRKRRKKMSAIDSGTLQQHSVSLDRSAQRTIPTSPPAGRAAPLAFALIEEDASSKGKRVARTGLALGIQILIVGTLLLMPLLVTEAIDLHQFDKTILIAPPPPAAPAPPVVHAQTVAPKISILHPQLTAPTIIPKKIAENVSDVGSAAPSISDAGGVAGGTGDVLGASLAAVAPPPSAPERPKGPIRISSGMKEPRLLVAPPVEYSPVARMARVQGTVTLEAIIDEHGNVTEVRAISGPAMLYPSAIKAVAGRKYEPTYLDGEPVAIRLDVTVNFHLG
jgi:periplasmic protein TonB